jgi:hypothetical protein
MSDDIGIEEFDNLVDSGFVSSAPTPPEEEFFKSIYIAGIDRKNHIGTTENAGKLQVRGKDYNKEEVNIVITNVKRVLVKTVMKQNNQESVECFCFLKGVAPWTSTSGRVCGATRADRDASEFCSSCRSQLIVAGLYCEPSGKPILNEDNSPVFCFLRGKGMKYNNISNYLGDLYDKDLPPIFEPATDETKEKEKQFVNNKRFVSRITVGEANSNYGIKKVFDLTAGAELPRDKVIDILKLAKKVQDKFSKKFDWSLNKTATGPGTSATPAGVLPFESAPVEPQVSAPIQQPVPEPPAPAPVQQPPVDNDFSFDDINF